MLFSLAIEKFMLGKYCVAKLLIQAKWEMSMCSVFLLCAKCCYWVNDLMIFLKVLTLFCYWNLPLEMTMLIQFKWSEVVRLIWGEGCVCIYTLYIQIPWLKVFLPKWPKWIFFTPCLSSHPLPALPLQLNVQVTKLVFLSPPFQTSPRHPIWIAPSRFFESYD